MHPPHIYKGIFWSGNPKLMYIGMQDQFYTFSMFDAQAWYARDVILGRIKLPSKAEMAEDIEKWVKREEALEGPVRGDRLPGRIHRAICCAATDYPNFDVDMRSTSSRSGSTTRQDSIVSYRDHAFKSPSRAPWRRCIIRHG